MIAVLLVLAIFSHAASAFQLTLPTSPSSSLTNNRKSVIHGVRPHDNDNANDNTNANANNNEDNDNVIMNQRRQFLQKVASTATSATTSAAIITLGGFTTTTAALAVDVEESAAVVAAASTASTAAPTASPIVQNTNTIEMKTFVDPKGLFAINVPKRFFAIRRTVKGDLPNEKTGQGRRGSSIFTAGDMSKAEVVAIERFPTRVLLEEEGILPSGDLSTFSSIGNPTAIANLIALRRDRDKQTQARTVVIPNSVKLSKDDKTLYFSLSQSIDVQKPELLMEQTGMSELVRVTLAKATLDSNDGQMMAVFASALQQDYMDVDGPALKECVDSFVALDQSSQLLEKK